GPPSAPLNPPGTVELPKTDTGVASENISPEQLALPSLAVTAGRDPNNPERQPTPTEPLPAKDILATKPASLEALGALLMPPGAPPPPTPSPRRDRPSPRQPARFQPDLTAVMPTSPIVTRGVVLTPEQRSHLWREFDERAAGEEAAYRRAALMLFAEERSNV